MKKSQKIWVGVGAFILAGSSTTPLHAMPPNDPSALGSEVSPRTPGGDDHFRHLAQAITIGQGGEAGEGGEGGEGGINVEAASKDPVEYGVALQVIAAHYHAGLAAYEGKEQEAGAQMFAHGLSEVYVEMEPVFKKLGINDLGKKLEAAVNAATEKKSSAEVRRRAKDVFAALAAAQKKAPRSPAPAPAPAVRAQVAVAMIERAAAQYSVLQKDQGLETYLDGLGFAMAARDLAKNSVPWLAKRDAEKGRAVSEALDLIGKTYPGINRPVEPKTTEADLLAAASRAKLAVSNL